MLFVCMLSHYGILVMSICEFWYYRIVVFGCSVVWCNTILCHRTNHCYCLCDIVNSYVDCHHILTWCLTRTWISCTTFWFMRHAYLTCTGIIWWGNAILEQILVWCLWNSQNLWNLVWIGRFSESCKFGANKQVFRISEEGSKRGFTMWMSLSRSFQNVSSKLSQIRDNW